MWNTTLVPLHDAVAHVLASGEALLYSLLNALPWFWLTAGGSFFFFVVESYLGEQWRCSPVPANGIDIQVPPLNRLAFLSLLSFLPPNPLSHSLSLLPLLRRRL